MALTSPIDQLLFFVFMLALYMYEIFTIVAGEFWETQKK
jgi:hypothetical protein